VKKTLQKTKTSTAALFGACLRLSLVAFLGVAIWFAIGFSAEAQTFRLSHITTPASPWHKGAERFVELVSRRTNGKVRIRIYPGASLAGRSQKTELQMVRSGVIHIHVVSPIILALFLDSRFDVYDLPWLFPSHEVAWRTLGGPLGDLGKKWLRKKGFVGLAWGTNGFRQLTNNKRPIRAPKDLSRIKFRVAGTRMYLRIFQLLGGNAVTMNFGEVFSSLQQGLIDGQENPLSVIASSRLYEVQKYLTLWNYSFDPLILSMNASWFDRLSPDLQKTFQESAREAMIFQRELVAKDDKTLPDFLEKKGMKVVRLTGVERSLFRERVKSIYKEWGPKLGQSVMNLALSEVRKAEKQTKREKRNP
jgi:tripartite ATP-independent transporter DctP family solute receptor